MKKAEQQITIEDIRRLCPMFEGLESLAPTVWSKDFEQCFPLAIDSMAARLISEVINTARNHLGGLTNPDRPW